LLSQLWHAAPAGAVDTGRIQGLRDGAETPVRPEQWVGWGDRTVDEMVHAWVNVTYLEQDDYDTLVAERAARE
jgi:hypothetical protein